MRQTLTDRLQRLETGRPGSALSSLPASADPRLADLIARIERLKGRARLRHGRASQATLVEKLGGVALAPGLIRIEREFPLWHRIGRRPLSSFLHVGGEHFQADPQQFLFLDTETTGLAGGTGTVAFMVGIGRLTPSASGFMVRQYLMTEFAAEGALLQALAGEVAAADTLVTFNGKSYDLPLLATRFRLRDRINPLAGLAHLDLRHPLRRIYGKQLPDCRLKTLEQMVLGHHREHDLPGSEAPKAWLNWLKNGETAELVEVARHNRADVLAMVALCHFLQTPELAAAG